MKKTFKLTPTMKIITQILNDYVAKNKILYLKKDKTYKLKITKAKREKELIVA